MRRSVPIRPCIRVAAAVLAVCGSAAAAHGDTISVLARTGMSTPYGAGSAYNRLISSGVELARPQISQSGDVWFYAVLNGSAVPSGTSHAVFCGTGQALQPMWRQGTQAIGLPHGVYFSGLTGMQINAVGEVAFIASLTGTGVQPGVNDRGVWKGDASGAVCIAREGTPVNLAGYPNTNIRWLTSTKVSSPEVLGPVIISGSIDTPGLGSGVPCVLQQSSTGFQPAMLANTQLSDAAPGTLILLTTPIVSPGGIGAYQTTLTGPGVTTVTVNGIPIVTNKAITAGIGQQHRTIARTGFQVPTEAAGVAYSMVWGGTARMSVNSNGMVAYSASMVGPGIAIGSNWGIWTDRNGQVSRVARLTDPAPIPGATIGSLGLSSGASFVTLTEDDAVVFTSMIMGTGISSANNGTIIHSRNGVRKLVARGGVDLSVLPAGVRIQNSNLGLGARVGSSGHVALAAKLEGTGVNSASDAAVFLWTPDHEPGLRLVCREGDRVGNYRITTLSQTGSDLHVNSVGQTVFTATVVDVNDSMMTPRTAIVAGAPDRSAWIVAVEGGQLALPSGAEVVRTVRMGTSGAFNDQGEVVFVVDVGTSTNPDEAVVIAQLRSDSTPPCRADYDNSGVLTVHDIYIFLTNWFRGEADYDNSGTTEVLDIFAFLSDWYAGCP